MDQRQSRLESDLSQTDQAYLSSVKVDSKKNRPAEISKKAAENDPEWRQFVRNELESMKNPGKTERDRTSKEAEAGTGGLPSLDQAASLLIEKVPFEKLLKSTMKYFMKKSKKRKKRRKK
ncbi:hypothetical protein [Paenibacillus ginsengarvi]|uniref:Uncharacterized protein n=1 Tax=Paenibacillus ginsengarvi TaxID=400777 RepID=A0A3B0CKR0_9BACL|nr:hypothetical protein [Paenibacillus ginsengarvi]RKN85318.1 hypothetical protein D7M11_09550 [Paenibacillus ginsengarvi]